MIKKLFVCLLLLLTACQTDSKVVEKPKEPPKQSEIDINKSKKEVKNQDNNEIVASNIEIPKNLLIDNIDINITHESRNNGVLVAIVKNNSNLTINDITIKVEINNQENELTYKQKLNTNKISKPFSIENIGLNPSEIKIHDIIVNFEQLPKKNSEIISGTKDNPLKQIFYLYRFNNFIIDIYDIPLTLEVENNILKAKINNNCPYQILEYNLNMVIDDHPIELHYDQPVDTQSISSEFGNISIQVDNLKNVQFNQVRVLAKYNETSNILLNYNFNPASASYEILHH